MKAPNAATVDLPVAHAVSEPAIVQQALHKLPWGVHVALLSSTRWCRP
jgi:hypothetical protein